MTKTTSRQALTRELEVRYGVHYRILSSSSPEVALAWLRELRAEGLAVPLVLADQWMTGMTGTEFLARVKDVMPTARRGLLISWGDRSTAAPILEASALGQMEFYLPKPAWSPDEQFHRAITEALEEWWREQGGRFEAVTVIGEEPSARTHEIRDILARNNVPFGFYRSDSGEGRDALARLGVSQPAGPVVALYNGVMLVNPGNAEMAEALGADVRPAGQTFDVVIVGAGPAGLAAAVYGGSEGLATALLEREAFGGQAGTSSRIRNYLGFPRGVSGVELAWRAYEQAWVFGTHFIYGNPAASLAAEEDLHVVGLLDGSQVRSRAVIVATGVSYRRLEIAGLESLVGAGVFYGASTIEAQAVAGGSIAIRLVHDYLALAPWGGRVFHGRRVGIAAAAGGDHAVGHLARPGGAGAQGRRPGAQPGGADRARGRQHRRLRGDRPAVTVLLFLRREHRREGRGAGRVRGTYRRDRPGRVRRSQVHAAWPGTPPRWYAPDCCRC